MANRKPDPPVVKATAATADELADRILGILNREVARLERRRKALELFEVDLLVRVLKAASEVAQFQLDPLGPGGRKKLERMTEAELDAAAARVERRPS